MAVITISRQYGSGGDEIAQRVSAALEYQLFSKQLIKQVAAEAGLSEDDIHNFSADVSEETFKIRGFFDKMLDNMAITSARMMFPDALPPLQEPQVGTLSDEAVFTLVQKAIAIAYQTGNIVIVGRGGQVQLHNKPDVLHVRIVSPLEDRIERVMEQLLLSSPFQGVSVDLRHAAQQLILQRDEASAAFLRHFYQAHWDDPLFYNLVINTGKTTIDHAVELIVRMISLRQLQDQATTSNAVKD